MGNDILMDVQHLSHIFRLNRKVEVHAVDDVSFQIKKRRNLRPGRRIRIREIDSGALCHEYIQTFRRRNLL